jgi:hypothetical protein
MTLLSSLYFLKILVVGTCHINKLPSSSPDAKNVPQGEIAIDLTHVVWNLNSIETLVGNGLRSLG